MLRYLLRVERGAKKYRLQEFHQGSAREDGMSYATLTRPTNWWRVAAITLGCIVAVAGVAIYRERTDTAIERDILDQRHRVDIESLANQLTTARETAESAEDEARASREAGERALAGTGVSEDLARGIAGTLNEIGSGDPELDRILGAIGADIELLADEFQRIRRELGPGDS